MTILKFGEYAIRKVNKEVSREISEMEINQKHGKHFLPALFLAVVFMLAGCGGNSDGADSRSSMDAQSSEESWLAAESSSLAETKAESVGAVYVDPYADGFEYLAPAGTDTVSLYVEREGVEPGTGTLTLYDDGDDSVVAEISADSSQVTFMPVSEEDKICYGMDKGTKVWVSLGLGLEAGKRYYVAVSPDFVRFGDVSSRELGGKEWWPIQVEDQ